MEEYLFQGAPFQRQFFLDFFQIHRFSSLLLKVMFEIEVKMAFLPLDMETLLLGLLFVWGRIGFGLRPGLGNLGLRLKCARLS